MLARGDETGLGFWTEEIRVRRSAQSFFTASSISIESDWTPPQEFPEFEGPVAIDLETYDPDINTRGPSWAFPGRGRIVGYAVATESFAGYYPTQHEGGDNLDHALVTGWIKSQLIKPSVQPVMANAPYDLGWLWREGIVPAGRCHDVQIQATLIDENRSSYKLDDLAKDELGFGKDEEILRRAAEQAGHKKGSVKTVLWKIPPKYVGPYGQQDAIATYELFKVYQQKIKDNTLEGVFLDLKERPIEYENLERIYDLESRLLPLSMMMRAKGVRVNVDTAERAKVALADKEQELIKHVKDLTGCSVSAWEADSIARALVAEGKVTVPRTAKTNRPSITKPWLQTIDTPVANAIRDIRRFNKARTTFIDGHILRHSENGRIHAEFNQLRSGGEEGFSNSDDERGTIARYSSTHPNLQQIPKRDPEIQDMIRSLFEPEEGEQWASMDYASQEPRLTVHFAAQSKVSGGPEAAQRYVEDPKTDYHQMVADLCGIPRSDAKAINLGITYGMGGAKLCRELKLPTEWALRENGRWENVTAEEAVFLKAQGKPVYEVAGEEGRQILKKYHEGAPFVKGMMDLAQNRAQERGFLITLLGRKCRFPFYRGTTERMMIHAALNRLIQGSAADQTKAAMLELWEKDGKIPLVTVHDELCFSVPSVAEAKYLAKVMQDVVKLKVPVIADIKIGPNWGMVKKWSDDRPEH